ncbi:MAG: sulfurtransferase complex subunit TusB [Hahellaceae bacterium]|nr:sulfurtransferase complex subunit TusB [Hahellaceae bacterium]
MLLHILNKSPKNTSITQQCLNALLPGDKLILIEDGVYQALPTTTMNPLLDALQIKGEIYVLEADVISRGLQNRLSEQVKLATFEDFVTLTEACTHTLTWA